MKVRIGFGLGTRTTLNDDGFGYDTVMLGQNGPLHIEIASLQQRLERPDHARVRAALAALEFETAIDLLSTYAGRGADLQAWLAHAEINRDRNLRLQYLAGLQLDSTSGMDAYHEIISRRQFPADLFRGSPDSVRALDDALLKPEVNP